MPAAAGFRMGARRRSAPTARRASRRWTASPSTSTSSTRRIHGLPGAPRCARSRGSSTKGSCGRSACRTSTGGSSTRRSSSRRWRPCRSRSARSTTAPSAAASSSAAPSSGSGSSPTRRSAGRGGPAGWAPGGSGRRCRGPDAAAAEVALAWLLALSPVVVPIPGARRPETARSAAAAARLVLDTGDREALDRSFGLAPRPSRPAKRDGEVVVVMGIPGAGKSRLAEDYVARGYVRLNRDERGGTLRDIAGALDEQLASGVARVVLDNTYLTRASRSHVLETAGRHGIPVRCVWFDTPLAQAQVNLVERLLDRFGGAASAGGAARARAARARRAHADDADAHASRARAPVGRRRLRRRGAGALRAYRRAWSTRRLRRGGRAGLVRARRGPPGRAAPRLRLAGPTAPWSRSPSRASPGRWRSRSARIPAARPRAGAARLCPGCRSRSRALTASTRRVRSSSARARRTGRSRRRSAPATSLV